MHVGSTSLTRRHSQCRRHEHRRFEDDLHHGGNRAGRRPRGGRGPAARPSRSCAGPPTSDTHWLDQWGVETVVGDLEDRRSASCRRRRGRLGVQLRRQGRRLGHAWRSSAGSTSRPSPPARCRRDARVERFVHVSSLGVYEGRDHYGTDETVPPAANSLDAYTRSKTEAEALVLEYIASGGSRAAIVRPGFIYGERDRTVLPKLLSTSDAGRSPTSARATRCSTASTSRTWSTGSSWPPRVPTAIGEVFNLTDGQRVTKKQFVGRVAELAGSAAAHAGTFPCGWPGSWPSWWNGAAKLRGAQKPPLINKARYKFLGLNLDYSIEKARRVLGYQPPFTFEQGIERAMAEHRPDQSRDEASRGRRTTACTMRLTRASRREVPSSRHHHRRRIHEQRQRQARRRPRREVLRGPGVMVSGPPPSRGRLRRQDRRAQGGRDLRLEARLPRQGGRRGERGQGIRLRRDHHSRRLLARPHAPASGDGRPGHPGAARESAGGDLPRPLDALLGEMPEGARR